MVQIVCALQQERDETAVLVVIDRRNKARLWLSWVPKNAMALFQGAQNVPVARRTTVMISWSHVDPVLNLQ